MSKSVTDKIEVEAISFFVPERSNPSQHYYFFSYKIRITNLGSEPARLISRHWIITDGMGRTHEVKGEGVVGEQPHLTQGMSFEYTSYCPLPTTNGQMMGFYQMMKEDGSLFEVRIPIFVLLDPESVN